ncbi:hypothetical protein PVAND_016389 [Polypedilum vanderplanki]|uniref:Uncharacterized protein n=1 Tax=Polypedilum vanderplanki TaxID=319348 RepID=A0A9J6BEY8_POLVA|nr:hypothetical protein PVAND_016389 [Polypedilum vanderplanki]
MWLKLLTLFFAIFSVVFASPQIGSNNEGTHIDNLCTDRFTPRGPHSNCEFINCNLTCTCQAQRKGNSPPNCSRYECKNDSACDEFYSWS